MPPVIEYPIEPAVGAILCQSYPPPEWASGTGVTFLMVKKLGSGCSDDYVVEQPILAPTSLTYQTGSFFLVQEDDVIGTLNEQQIGG